MYIICTIDENNYQFQVNSSSGVSMGEPRNFPKDQYKLREYPTGTLCVLPLSTPDNTFPPKASYPMNRLIIINDGQV